MRIIVVITLSIISYASSCQIVSGNSLNKFVPDSTVVNVMNDALDPRYPYKTSANHIKKIYKHPIHLSEAPWMFKAYLGGDPDKLNFDYVLELLIDVLNDADTIFSNKDIEFISRQYRENPLKCEWPNFKKRTMKKKTGRRVWEFSVPLFSEDRSSAIIWSYYYVGPLHAYSTLGVYRKVDGRWKFIVMLDGWIA